MFTTSQISLNRFSCATLLALLLAGCGSDPRTTGDLEAKDDSASKSESKAAGKSEATDAKRDSGANSAQTSASPAADGGEKASTLSTDRDDPQGPQFAPVASIGTVNGLVIPVAFPGETVVFNEDQLDALFNEQGYTGLGNNGSVRDYFNDVSQGKFNLTNVVAPYFTAPNPKSAYESGTASKDDLVKAALEWAVDQGIDLQSLTRHDGKVDALYLMYTGDSTSDNLRTHQTTVNETVDGIAFNRVVFAAMSNDLDIGTIVHETGHMLLGWRDTYDYGDESLGLGHHDGISNSKNPARPNAYFRVQAGWETPTDISALPEGTKLTLETNGNQSYRYIKPGEDPSNPKEFFLIEARRKSGRDSTLPDEGLMILHVDEKMNGNDSEVMSRTAHYRLSLVQADGYHHLERGFAAGGEVNDLFRAGVSTTFNDGTMPNAHFWDATPSGLSIRNISAVGDTMSFEIGAKAPDAPAPGTSLTAIPNQEDSSVNIELMAPAGSATRLRYANVEIYRGSELLTTETVILGRTMSPEFGSTKISLSSWVSVGQSTDFTAKLYVNKTIVAQSEFTLEGLQGGILNVEGPVYFENAVPGTTKATVVLSNTGTTPVRINEVYTNNTQDFTVDWTEPRVIAPSSSITVPVTYFRREGAVESGGLIVVENDSVNAGPDKLLSIDVCDYQLKYNVPARTNGSVVPGSIQYVPDCHRGDMATFSLYALDANGEKAGAPIQVVDKMIAPELGQQTIPMPDWTCMPRGKYRLEMTKAGTSTVYASTNFEKTIDMYLFYLAAGPTPVLSEAKFYFRNDDQNLVGKLARVAVTKGDTVYGEVQGTLVQNSNELSMKFGRFVTLAPGDYTAKLYVNGFLVDSSTMTKADINHDVAFNVDSFNFGGITLGESRTVMLTLFNRGNTPAMISGIRSSDPQFAVTNKPTPFSLAPGARTGIDVTYTPTRAGETRATLSFINAPDESIQTLELPVSGSGL